MLWIALHLPRLSLDLIERSRPNTAPIAICNHLQILSANQTALNGGVTPGSRRASAQALLPEIELIAHDPVREQQALTTLACWALQFTPSVAFAPAPLPERQALRRASGKPDKSDDTPGASQQVAVPLPAHGEAGLLLEIAPSLKLFGGLAALLEQLLEGLQQLGYQSNLGVAGTCHGAWLLALSQPMRAPQSGTTVQLPTRRRAGQVHPGRAPNPVSAMQATDQTTDHVAPSSDAPGDATVSAQSLEHMQDPDALMQRLSPLPLSLLRHASTHLNALRTIGAHSIGDLLELPRAGLARRFGKKLLLEIDAALGVHPQPIGFFSAPEQFAAKLELMADVERTEPLLYAGRRLIFELAGWLAARQAGVRSFDLILEHNTPPVTSLSVRLTNASRDPLRLIGLLRERLDILQLRTSVHTIHLRCSRVQSLAQASQTLFDSPASTHESLGRLLERLQVRLGREQVQRLHLAQDHRPEAAYEIRVIDKLDDLGKLTSQTKPTTNTEQHDQFKTIAGELFCASTGTLPRPLWLLREPNPLAERNNRPWLNSVLTVLAGPERIETGWWDTRLIQRDYFVAEDDTNTLYWIFRERHRGWFVHGKFG